MVEAPESPEEPPQTPQVPIPEEVMSRLDALLEQRDSYWDTHADRFGDEVMPFSEMVEADKAEVEDEVRRIFTVDDFGPMDDIDAVVSEVKFLGPMPGSEDETWEYPTILVTGKFTAEMNGKEGELGTFNRALVLTSENPVGIPHVVQQPVSVKIAGVPVAAEFAVATEPLYADLGAEAIILEAGPGSSTYAWALQGGRYVDEEAKKIFLGQVIGAIRKSVSGDQMASAWFAEGQAKQFYDLAKQSLEEPVDDEAALTPYVFTLFPGAPEALSQPQGATSRHVLAFKAEAPQEPAQAASGAATAVLNWIMENNPSSDEMTRWAKLASHLTDGEDPELNHWAMYGYMTGARSADDDFKKMFMIREASEDAADTGSADDPPSPSGPARLERAGGSEA